MRMVHPADRWIIIQVPVRLVPMNEVGMNINELLSKWIEKMANLPRFGQLGRLGFPACWTDGS